MKINHGWPALMGLGPYGQPSVVYSSVMLFTDVTLFGK